MPGVTGIPQRHERFTMCPANRVFTEIGESHLALLRFCRREASHRVQAFSVVPEGDTVNLARHKPHCRWLSSLINTLALPQSGQVTVRLR